MVTRYHQDLDGFRDINFQETEGSIHRIYNIYISGTFAISKDVKVLNKAIKKNWA